MKMIEQLKVFERLDQLIRLKATGTPKDLACRLNISERSLYKYINAMKSMGAPIQYCNDRKSYCYQTKVKFTFGFDIIGNEDIRIKGGIKILTHFNTSLQDFCSNHQYLCLR